MVNTAHDIFCLITFILFHFRITHILNVTREIDNFYPQFFVYENVRLYDIESSDLLKHWDRTWRFISDVK